MSTHFSSEVVLSALSEDLLSITHEIGWCTMATVDRAGRPRSRVLHVNWRQVGDGLRGWAATGRTPTKADHLDRNPYVSCAYWSSAHAAVFVDCIAEWTEEAPVKEMAFALIEEEAAQRGFSAREMWPQGAQDPGFELLELRAWRAQVTLPDLESGKTVASSRVWHESHPEA